MKKLLLLLSILCSISIFGMNDENKKRLLENDKTWGHKKPKFDTSKNTTYQDLSDIFFEEPEKYCLDEPDDLLAKAQSQILNKQKVSEQNFTFQAIGDKKLLLKLPIKNNFTIQKSQTIACCFCNAQFTANMSCQPNLKLRLKNHILEECDKIKSDGENIITSYKNATKKDINNSYQATCTTCSEIFSGTTLNQVFKNIRNHPCLQNKLLQVWQTVETIVDSDMQNPKTITTISQYKPESLQQNMTPKTNKVQPISINKIAIKIMPKAPTNETLSITSPISYSTRGYNKPVPKEYVFPCPLCDAKLSASDTKNFKQNVRSHFYQYCTKVNIDSCTKYENDAIKCNKCLQLFRKKNRNSSARGEFLKHNCSENNNRKIFWKEWQLVEKSFDSKFKNSHKNNSTNQNK